MTKNNAESDSWGQLLSNFGIEDRIQEDTTKSEELKTVEPAETVKQPKVSSKSTESPEFGAGLIDSEAEDTDESTQPRGKKSIFSRFPKINFFGAPPEVSLDSVIEGVKSPSLGGKAFTDNKLEKMPLSQEWTDRQGKNNVAEPALTAVASQIDVLASGRDTKAKPGDRPAKRNVSSMFDEPIPVSEEERALKDIMGEPPRREESNREEIRRDAFLEDEADTWQHGGRGRQKPLPKEKAVRGCGSRHRPSFEENNFVETDFEPVDDEAPQTRGRGRRGSRYAESNYRDREPIQDDAPQEEWSEVDAALQAGRRSEPVQRERGARRPRYDKRQRPERMEPAFDREASNIEDTDIVAVHGNVPSWDEAIGDIVAANIARHKSYSGRGRR